MVNFQFNLVSMLGMVLAVAGAGLYFLRSVRPELTRDYDVFFSAIGLVCGGIFLWQGWRYDPIMQFGQVLLGGAAIFFAFESIRLRGITTVQAKRNTSFVDEDRPVGAYQEAELDELNPYDDVSQPPRIYGARDRNSARRSGYVDELEEDARSPRPARRSSAGARPRPNGTRPPSSEAQRSRRPQRPAPTRAESADQDPNERRRSAPRPTMDRPEPTKPPRSPRPSRPRPGASPEAADDYVDYQPMDYTDYSDPQESDNSANFDDDW